MKERYSINFPKKDFKKELKTLKLNNASINIIKYVAKKTRSRINKNPINITIATDNDDKISRNFWGYTKKVVRSGSSVLPSFDVVHGTNYFTNALKCVNRMKGFIISSWIPKLKEPNIPFNLSPPGNHTNYQAHEIVWFTIPVRPDINNLFQAMSILKIIYIKFYTEVLRSNTLPTQWTKAATVLIYKKGDPNLPNNFRSITLPKTSKFKNIYIIASKQSLYVFNQQSVH